MKKNPSPAISVVIPTYNGRGLLAKHLPDVEKILQPGDEIIIVDDASSDDTIAWLEKQTAHFDTLQIDLRWVHLETNQRFARAVNAGVSLAAHPYILLLNNDVSPLSPDLREQLLAWFTQPDFFAVGCAEVRENQPEAPLFGRGTGDFQRGFLTHWYDPEQYTHATLWTAGGSMLFDRVKFETLGGFDPLFAPAYEEDRDLSYRALKHGWHLAFEYRARVWHQHETTNQSVFGKRPMEIISWKNQFIMVWKNVTDPLLVLQHWLWLPYHLTITNWRTRGTLGRGFWRALRQLPAILAARRALTPLWQHTDRQVLQQAQQEPAAPPFAPTL